MEPQLLLAWPSSSAASLAALSPCQPASCHDTAAVGAVVSPSRPCLPLHPYPTAGPVWCSPLPRARGGAHRRLAIYGTTIVWALLVNGCTCLSDCVYTCDALIARITSCHGKAMLSPLAGPVSLFLFVDRHRAAPPNYPAIDHFHSIHHIHGFTITFSTCSTLPSHEEGTAKLQFGAFPHRRAIKATLGHGREQPSYLPS